jgi:hypothetical protein
MTKKHRKQKIISRQIGERKYQVYSMKSSDNIVPTIVALIFFGFGIGLLGEKQYFMSFFIISLSAMVVYALITSIQSLSIAGENIFVDYVFKTDIFRAKDIETVDWGTSIEWRRGTPYRSSSFLLIKMTNGRKVRIPGSPFSRFDIQKTILDWRDKYKLPDLENTEQESTNS